jgi:NAD(P)-dependent dehydrogenase (short-subunit alcohol dehydrogenase family)
MAHPSAANAASKGAVISLTKIAVLQLAQHNINVNAMCPGVTRMVLSEATLRVRAQQEHVTVEEMERWRDQVIPIGRAHDPEDIAAMAVFLACPGARNITGQSLLGSRSMSMAASFSTDSVFCK